MFRFPQPFQHQHPPVQDAHEVFASHSSLGQRAADRLARIAGSWTFILVQSALLGVWVALNVTAYVRHWDPYPFILMNLMLSLQAAYTAPVIMMSQNRQAERDRIEARNDFQINLKAEKEVRVIMEHLEAQNLALIEIHRGIETLQTRLATALDGRRPPDEPSQP